MRVHHSGMRVSELKLKQQSDDLLQMSSAASFACGQENWRPLASSSKQTCRRVPARSPCVSMKQDLPFHVISKFTASFGVPAREARQPRT